MGGKKKWTKLSNEKVGFCYHPIVRKADPDPEVEKSYYEYLERKLDEDFDLRLQLWRTSENFAKAHAADSEYVEQQLEVMSWLSAGPDDNEETQEIIE